MSDFQFNHQQVIQILSEQIAALTRDNAMLVSALQLAMTQDPQIQGPSPEGDSWEA